MVHLLLAILSCYSPVSKSISQLKNSSLRKFMDFFYVCESAISMRNEIQTKLRWNFMTSVSLLAEGASPALKAPPLQESNDKHTQWLSYTIPRSKTCNLIRLLKQDKGYHQRMCIFVCLHVGASVSHKQTFCFVVLVSFNRRPKSPQLHKWVFWRWVAPPWPSRDLDSLGKGQNVSSARCGAVWETA